MNDLQSSFKIIKLCKKKAIPYFNQGNSIFRFRKYFFYYIAQNKLQFHIVDHKLHTGKSLQVF